MSRKKKFAIFAAAAAVILIAGGLTAYFIVSSSKHAKLPVATVSVDASKTAGTAGDGESDSGASSVSGQGADGQKSTGAAKSGSGAQKRTSTSSTMTALPPMKTRQAKADAALKKISDPKTATPQDFAAARQAIIHLGDNENKVAAVKKYATYAEAYYKYVNSSSSATAEQKAQAKQIAEKATFNDFV